jgi:hypothetical protein
MEQLPPKCYVTTEEHATLRDQFAMAAMKHVNWEAGFDCMAKNYYRLADAMLKAREWKEEGNGK